MLVLRALEDLYHTLSGVTGALCSCAHAPGAAGTIGGGGAPTGHGVGIQGAQGTDGGPRLLCIGPLLAGGAHRSLGLACKRAWGAQLAGICLTHPPRLHPRLAQGAETSAGGGPR